MYNGGEFGETLDAYVRPLAEYEAWLEETEGERYVDTETRWEWAREDWARMEVASAAAKEREKGRDAIRAAQAEKRKAERGEVEENGAEGVKAAKGEKSADAGKGTPLLAEDVGEAAEEEEVKVQVGVCNGVTCSV